jgi:hypothetical protein
VTPRSASSSSTAGRTVRSAGTSGPRPRSPPAGSGSLRTLRSSAATSPLQSPACCDRPTQHCPSAVCCTSRGRIAGAGEARTGRGPVNAEASPRGVTDRSHARMAREQAPDQEAEVTDLPAGPAGRVSPSSVYMPGWQPGTRKPVSPISIFASWRALALRRIRGACHTGSWSLIGQWCLPHALTMRWSAFLKGRLLAT